MKLPWTVGVEVTGVPKEPFDQPQYHSYMDWFGRPVRYTTVDWDRAGKAARAVARSCGKKAHVDSHCMEVPSPIFYDINAFKRWFIKTRKELDKRGYYPKHPDVVDGGGHIHVGMAGPFAARVMKDVQSRPYLPWVFSEPDEADSCDNKVADVMDWGKGSSIRKTGFGTVEFRFFEAASNWSEQWDHLDFLFHYLRFLLRSRPITREKPFTRRQLNAITCQDAITSFRKLLGDIGLPYHRYQKYVNRNLIPRWDLGRVRR